ncbi:hypothetical protein ABZP36_007031 [Zizania latifolia]
MSLSEKLEAARVALGKRKERELLAQGPAKAEPGKTAPAPGNKLLAGQLAHEFLARGTLRGRPVEPSRSSSPALASPGAVEPEPEPEREPDPKRRYAEVSWLLMASGARVPGVVNPTQLGRWLQIKD